MGCTESAARVHNFDNIATIDVSDDNVNKTVILNHSHDKHKVGARNKNRIKNTGNRYESISKNKVKVTDDLIYTRDIDSVNFTASKNQLTLLKTEVSTSTPCPSDQVKSKLDFDVVDLILPNVQLTHFIADEITIHNGNPKKSIKVQCNLDRYSLSNLNNSKLIGDNESTIGIITTTTDSITTVSPESSTPSINKSTCEEFEEIIKEYMKLEGQTVSCSKCKRKKLRTSIYKINKTSYICKKCIIVNNISINDVEFYNESKILNYKMKCNNCEKDVPRIEFIRRKEDGDDANCFEERSACKKCYLRVKLYTYLFLNSSFYPINSYNIKKNIEKCNKDKWSEYYNIKCICVKCNKKLSITNCLINQNDKIICDDCSLKDLPEIEDVCNKKIRLTKSEGDKYCKGYFDHYIDRWYFYSKNIKGDIVEEESCQLCRNMKKLKERWEDKCSSGSNIIVKERKTSYEEKKNDNESVIENPEIKCKIETSKERNYHYKYECKNDDNIGCCSKHLCGNDMDNGDKIFIKRKHTSNDGDLGNKRGKTDENYNNNDGDNGGDNGDDDDREDPLPSPSPSPTPYDRTDSLNCDKCNSTIEGDRKHIICEKCFSDIRSANTSSTVSPLSGRRIMSRDSPPIQSKSNESLSVYSDDSGLLNIPPPKDAYEIYIEIEKEEVQCSECKMHISKSQCLINRDFKLKCRKCIERMDKTKTKEMEFCYYDGYIISKKCKNCKKEYPLYHFIKRKEKNKEGYKKEDFEIVDTCAKCRYRKNKSSKKEKENIFDIPPYYYENIDRFEYLDDDEKKLEEYKKITNNCFICNEKKSVIEGISNGTDFYCNECIKEFPDMINFEQFEKIRTKTTPCEGDVYCEYRLHHYVPSFYTYKTTKEGKNHCYFCKSLKSLSNE